MKSYNALTYATPSSGVVVHLCASFIDIRTNFMDPEPLQDLSCSSKTRCAESFVFLFLQLAKKDVQLPDLQLIRSISIEKSNMGFPESTFLHSFQGKNATVELHSRSAEPPDRKLCLRSWQSPACDCTIQPEPRCYSGGVVEGLGKTNGTQRRSRSGGCPTSPDGIAPK